MTSLDYRAVWDRLPERLRDAFGTRAFTPDELRELVSFGVPLTQARWVGGPPAPFEVARGFELWVADLLARQADELDGMPERVAAATIPLNERDRDMDPAPVSEDVGRRAATLRQRAQRLRNGVG